MRTSNSVVTVDMLLRALNHCVSKRTVFRIFARNGIKFRSLPRKALIRARSVQARFDWAVAFRQRPVDYWKRAVFLDNKFFPCFNTRRGKIYSSRSLRRGIFRKRGKIPGFFNYRICGNPRMKFGTGSCNIVCSLAVSWDGIEVLKLHIGKWNSRKAVLLYRTLARKVFARKPNYFLVEDNDPAGFSSPAGLQAKRALGIETVKLPPYSPELMPLDFSIFSFISRRIAESNSMALNSGLVETKSAYLDRIRRIIMRTPLEFIRNSIKDIPNRIRTLYNCGGDVFFD